jgi:hypothetical protein
MPDGVGTIIIILGVMTVCAAKYYESRRTSKSADGGDAAPALSPDSKAALLSVSEEGRRSNFINTHIKPGMFSLFNPGPKVKSNPAPGGQTLSSVSQNVAKGNPFKVFKAKKMKIIAEKEESVSDVAPHLPNSALFSSTAPLEDVSLDEQPQISDSRRGSWWQVRRAPQL